MLEKTIDYMINYLRINFDTSSDKWFDDDTSPELFTKMREEAIKASKDNIDQITEFYTKL